MSNSSNKYITEERVIPYISDVVKYLGLNFNTENSPETETSSDSGIYREFNLENDIFNIANESVDKIFDKINGNIEMCKFCTRVIEYALKIRPKQNETLFSLLFKLSKVIEYTPNSNLIYEHKKILVKKGIAEEDSDDLEKEKLLDETSIEKAIREDSVNTLIELTAQNGFNPQGKLKISKERAIHFVNEDINKWSIREIEVTYMQVMAYFGSVNCFKYALIDGSFDEKDLSKYAIAGGNNEIIHLLEQKGVSFDNCFETSIRYHRNDISDWLLRNYKCEIFELSNAIEYFNIPAFFFLLKNNISSTESSFNSALISSSKVGSLSLVKYMIDNGANIESKTKKGSTPLYKASLKGNLNVVKYLVDKGANIEVEDKDGRRPLHKASKNSSIEVVEYLIDNGANKNVKDKCGWTALHWASFKGKPIVVKYLIDKGVDIEAKDDDGLAPLHIASIKGKLDIVICLIDKGANIQTEDNYIWTPLHYASSNGKIDIVNYLIDKGANKEVRNKHGYKPLECGKR